MTIAILATTALALLCLPGWARPLGRRLPAWTWKRLTVAAVVAGALALELSLLAQAAPTVLRTVGGTATAAWCERMLHRLAPGGPVIGWLAFGGSLLAAGAGVRTWTRSRRCLALLRVEQSVGRHFRHGRLDVAVVPVPGPLAYSRGGSTPQVVLSEGLLRVVDDDQVELVVAHERHHVEERDERLLMVLAAVRGAWGWLPAARRSIRVAQVAIERSADEAAAGADPESRAALADALLAAVGCLLAADAAAFGAADGIDERVQAMRRPPVAITPLPAVGAFMGAGGLGVTLCFAAASWAMQADRVVAMTGTCLMK